MMKDIWERLVHGKRLDEAGLPRVGGRVDLRNLHVPKPHAVESIRASFGDVTVLGGTTSVSGASWRSIDFSSAQLPGLRFLDCQIQDCVFDRCMMPDVRIWRTDFSKVSFRAADLRGTVLGGTNENDSIRNSFYDVDFTDADMRGTIYGAVEFVRCNFNNANLNKVDFQSSTFTDCSFEGELREVLFYRTGFRCERFPPNEMKQVDFRRAKLRWCEFRGLDLDKVLFPEDTDHVVIENYPEALDRLLASFRGRPDLVSRRLVALFELDKKWLGPRQKVGILNKRDLIESVGEDGLRAVINILGRSVRLHD